IRTRAARIVIRVNFLQLWSPELKLRRRELKFEPLDLELTGGELEFEPLELKFSRLWRCTKPEAGALELTCLQTRPGKSEGGPLPEPAAARRALSADL